MIDLTLFPDPSRDVPIETKFVSQLAKPYLALRRGLKYHNFDFKILPANDPSIVCTYLMNFDPVTPEITRVYF